MNDYDLVIIGAGIQGAGIAQAGAAAGYRILVLEERDIAAATSRASSKLIHGGLRYLETGQLSLVRESLSERALLLKLAPELVKLAPLHIPVYRGARRSCATIAAGLGLYHLLSGFDRNTRFRRLPRREWGERDGLQTRDLKSVFRYCEAQTDDAALTRAVMRSALSLDTELLMPARFDSARLTPDGVDVVFEAAGRRQQARAGVLINAAGPWASRLHEQIENAGALPATSLVQGSHLILPPLLRHHYYLESPTDGRAVFALPWQGRLLVGTTEAEHRGDPAEAHCHPWEMHYLIHILKHYFPDLHILPHEAQTTAGLRVLPHTGASAFNRSRDVMICPQPDKAPRLITVMGGKLTTYRATAEQVIRKARPALPRVSRRADTRRLALEPD